MDAKAKDLATKHLARHAGSTRLRVGPSSWLGSSVHVRDGEEKPRRSGDKVICSTCSAYPLGATVRKAGRRLRAEGSPAIRAVLTADGAG